MPYRWDEGYGARLGVMSRTPRSTDVRWYDVDPYYVFHVGNAYEDTRGRIVLDAVRYDRAGFRHTWSDIGGQWWNCPTPFRRDSTEAGCRSPAGGPERLGVQRPQVQGLSCAHRHRDEELTRRAQAGETGALGLLLARHQAPMRAVAMSLLGYGPDAEDVVQDAALTVLRRIGDVRDPAAVGAWLRAVVRNAARMRLRVTRETPGLDGLDPRRAGRRPWRPCRVPRVAICPGR
ncbi:sigma factor [Streptomyces mirabilis]|uniref:RNA polymerase sigma factor n=1 Tax=Streptomyces mirabilis TaxID=68239 RepID=UPI00367CA32C